MALLLIALLWGFMALRIALPSQALFAWVGFGASLFAVLITWRVRSKTPWKSLAAATLPVALVFGFTAGSATSNPKLEAQANRFVTLTLQLETTGEQKFGRVPVRIVKPNQLGGAGTLFAAQLRLGCPRATISGDFLVTPPREHATAQNQVALRPIGQVGVNCGHGFLVEILKAGQEARNRVAAAVAMVSAPGSAKALVLGLTDGDTGLLSAEFNTKLKELSLTHLNAVSGANCAIVVATLFGVLALLGLGRVWRVVGALIGLAGYLFLVGPQPSVIRAAAMACIALAALTIGSRPRGLSILALGVLVLLWLDPILCLNYGFALSALATWGVIQLAPPLNQQLRVSGLPLWLSLSVAVALAAQLACLPVLVLLQSKFSVYSTLANVLVEPVVPVITVLGVAGATVAQLWPPLAVPLFWLASVPAAYLASVADFFAAQGSNLSWPVGLAGLGLAVALLAGLTGFLLLKNRVRWLGLAAVLLVTVGFTSFGVNQWFVGRAFAAGDWFYVSCDVGQGDATVIRSAAQIAVIDVGRDPGPVDRCLKRLGISHINLLVLTHFDLDHVGGVAGALAGRKVDRALLTDFIDDRPGAVTTEETVVRAGIPVQHVHLGDNGTLGEFSWLVLSPHLAGADALDSNDGSVTMFWHSGRVNLITLADLPATGQMRLAAERASWWREDYRNQPLIMKVSHHGSADQYPELLEWLQPTVATVSVGAGNDYGHPTQFTLHELQSIGALILRTDLQGSLSLAFNGNRLTWAAAGAG